MSHLFFRPSPLLLLLSFALLSLLLTPSLAHGGEEHGTVPPSNSSSTIVHSEHLPLAFGLTFLSGFFTCVGATLPFFSSKFTTNQASFLYKVQTVVASDRFLASCLAIAAGVMCFSGLGSLLPESREIFESETPGHSELAATGSFFLGIFLLVSVDALVHCLRPNHGPNDFRKHLSGKKEASVASTNELELEANGGLAQQEKGQPAEGAEGNSRGERKDSSVSSTQEGSPSELEIEPDAKADLRNTGIVTAIAIAIHNFPEGLATFTATLVNPHVGIVLAIAIALHNIPEGICISMPIYYSTGSKVKAFLFTLVVGGLSEPLGALMGYLVLAHFWSPLADAVLHGFTSGLMTFISIKGLLPMAIKHDPTNKVTTLCFFIGLLIIALSLIIFQYAE